MFIDGALCNEVDVDASLGLADPADAGPALLVVGVAEIQRVVLGSVGFALR